MNEFIRWLEKLNEGDTRVRAVLRRSLAFEPGNYPPAYPFVEPFVRDQDSSWRREMLYLAAGLWAMHWREGRFSMPTSIGKVCAELDKENRNRMSREESQKISATENRFVTLLDSDSDQLPHRLRQMVALLKDYSIDFASLLRDIIYWNDDRKRTQQSWARDFYRNLHQESEESKTDEEEEKHENVD